MIAIVTGHILDFVLPVWGCNYHPYSTRSLCSYFLFSSIFLFLFSSLLHCSLLFILLLILFIQYFFLSLLTISPQHTSQLDNKSLGQLVVGGASEILGNLRTRIFGTLPRNRRASPGIPWNSSKIEKKIEKNLWRELGLQLNYLLSWRLQFRLKWEAGSRKHISLRFKQDAITRAWI